MRKRAQRKSKSAVEIPKHIVKQMRPKIETKPSGIKKNWWIALTLIGLFLLVLFLNTYFNLTSEVAINPDGEGFEKFYLSGPDPYYNMRLVEGTYETGSYPYYSGSDPLLNYPLGARGGRAPLFNMMAIGFSRFLTPFMNEIDAVGYSMQFIPALFGALLIFPVYFIGKELFNRKAGIIGAMFLAIIPIHLGSGHGSAYSLFDHDSFNLLLFFLTFLFLIKSLKEKDSTRSIIYAVMAGVPLAALTMVWVEAQYLYVIIAIYAIVQMFLDIFTNKIDIQVFRTTSIVLFSGYLISLPVLASRIGFDLNVRLFLCIAITAFGAVYYIFGRQKIPWTLSLPTIFSIAAIGLVFLYFVEDLAVSFKFLAPLSVLRRVIFGTGIYGSKVSLTIAEANTYQISHTVISFGPALYWIAWFGFVLLIYYYYKNRQRREYLFIIMLFIVNIWLATTAGRFLNDMVPLIAILGGWIVWMFVDWLDYKQMFKNIKRAGGGFHGIRRGVKFLHIFGIIFLAFLVILPNVFVAFDAAVPNTIKLKDDGENWTSLKGYMFDDDTYRGAFGLGVGKERYWTDAFGWLSEQDTDIEDFAQRPAFISWWDYGFYEVALGDHPTVADNFQDGIPVAANFHTSTSEKEAVIVLSVRLLEGNRYFNGKLTDDVVDVLRKHLGENTSEKIKNWVEDQKSSPSYGMPIGAEYDENTSKDYLVGQQYAFNAVYHDAVDLLTSESIDPETNKTIGLTDDEITWLYHDLQEATGYSIRYYGVEGYDKQIFNIFGFLSDKSLIMINGIADDFIELFYSGYEVDQQGNKEPNSDFSIPASKVIDMSLEERRYMVFSGTHQKYKDPYFDTMFYKTYIGPAKDLEDGSKEEYDWQVPCIDMKHFYAEYISDLSKYPYYDTGKGAVVIAKYYEGAYVNGTVTSLGEPVDAQVVVQKNLTYYANVSFPIEHDKVNTNASGAFNLIAGAGNITLVIRKSLGQGAFILKNVTFNGAKGSELEPISDNDAMRKKDSNYERILNITIEPANLSGHVYNDLDDDGIYNNSVDEPIFNMSVVMREIIAFKEDQTVELDDDTIILTTNESGYYNISDLSPGIYRVIIYDNNDFIIHFNDVALYEGNNGYDAANVKPARIEGIVYYDRDGDDEYDPGEEEPDIDVDLILEVEQLERRTTIVTVKTDANGRYVFDPIVPGVINNVDLNKYIIKASKLPEYLSEETAYPVENVTTWLNISISLAPVDVTGTVWYEGEPIVEVGVFFDPDEFVENNTAVADYTPTEFDGTYVIGLQPGYYNVTLVKYDGETLVYALTGEKLTIGIGSRPIPKDYELIKFSSTAIGITTFEGNNVDNITINFEPTDGSAIATSIMSDDEGEFRVELTTGNYNVTVNQEMNVSGEIFNYVYSRALQVSANNSYISPITIALTRED